MAPTWPLEAESRGLVEHSADSRDNTGIAAGVKAASQSCRRTDAAGRELTLTRQSSEAEADPAGGVLSGGVLCRAPERSCVGCPLPVSDVRVLAVDDL